MNELLTNMQRAQLTTRLKEYCLELRNTLENGQAAGKTVELDQTRQGRLSRMDAMQGQAMAQAATARTRKQIKLAETRLNQVNDSHFGCCDECGELIVFARLMSNPTACLCIQCAQTLETNHAR